MEVTDLYWLAGLLEGEGCFAFNRTPKITIAMTDEDIIQRVSILFNTSYRALPQRHEGYKTVYRTEVFGERAISLMLAILPNMGTRRSAKINEVIKLARARPGIAKGERAQASKVNDEQAKVIKMEYENRHISGETGWSIANKYNITQAAVWYITNKRYNGSNAKQ